MNVQERLNDACRVGDIGGIRAALADGADVNAEGPTTLFDLPWEPIAVTCIWKQTHACAYLLSVGAQIIGPRALLDFACTYFPITKAQPVKQIAELLIQYGVNPRPNDDYIYFQDSQENLKAWGLWPAEPEPATESAPCA